MGAIANITVKNKAAADVIYVAKTPSAGDKVPALWALDAASTIIGQRPTLSVVTRDNGRGNGRHLSVVFKFPIVATIDGIPVVQATVPMTLEATLPTNVDATKVSDAFVQFGNLLVSTLLREVAETGFAPT